MQVSDIVSNFAEFGMKQAVSFNRLARYERNVPRYTSYPTAVQFTESVGFDTYKKWLQTLQDNEAVSLYLHVPFCDELCKFCACNTQVIHKEALRIAYGELLCDELYRLKALLKSRRRVGFIHFGGGTPTTLPPITITKIMNTIRQYFNIEKNADISIELDPRHASSQYILLLNQLGFTRISIGVQDLDPKVQEACGRVQSLAMTSNCIEIARKQNITSINIDLIYGLPNQTCKSLSETIQSIIRLKPDRLAVFGYAHVPWKHKRQNLLNGEILPDTLERFKQRQLIDDLLRIANYQIIGLDHYALPHDSMSKAAKEGKLHRNFQGYTIDNAVALLGIGASSVSILPQGIVQNQLSAAAYQKAMRLEGLPIAKGVSRTIEDLLRWSVIEHLMCNLYVDLEILAKKFKRPKNIFDNDLLNLVSFEEDGLILRDYYKIKVTEQGRPFLRNIANIFDVYYQSSPHRHAQAI